MRGEAGRGERGNGVKESDGMLRGASFWGSQLSVSEEIGQGDYLRSMRPIEQESASINRISRRGGDHLPGCEGQRTARVRRFARSSKMIDDDDDGEGMRARARAVSGKSSPAAASVSLFILLFIIFRPRPNIL